MYQKFVSQQGAVQKPQVTYTIIATANPPDGGTVSRNPDQTYYTYGTNVNIMAIPADGYTFTGWVGDATGDANVATVAMDGNKTLTANFQYIQQTYKLTTNVTPPGGGTITRYPDKEAYIPGEEVSIMATAENGYTFTGWTGVVAGRANRTTITGKINRDMTMTANFYKKLEFESQLEPITQTNSDTLITSVSQIGSGDVARDDERNVAKNVLLIDALPLIPMIFMIGDNGHTLGIGLQYERKLFNKFSLIGRYDYFGVWDNDDSYQVYHGYNDYTVDDRSCDMHSFEIHTRYYLFWGVLPFMRGLFLDGMLGYCVNTISGSIRRNDYDYYNYNARTYDYIEGGVSFGFQISFWEFSVGWNFAFNYPTLDSERWYIDDHRMLYAGGGAGPRFVSAFGYRF